MSNIEWTNETWNPVVGCKAVSPGCTNCYAATMAARLATMPHTKERYAGLTRGSGAKAKWTGVFRTVPEALAKPLSWRKPRRVFVNSMSDLFGEGVPFEFIARVFDVMEACPQHTFQVLTKRPERALVFLEWFASQASARRCPLPNVWLGVSVENQPQVARVLLLRQCPAAVRFVSVEPLLESIDLSPHLRVQHEDEIEERIGRRVINPDQSRVPVGVPFHDPWVSPVDWVIVGGESGPGARPCHEEWERAVLRQCAAAGVAAFRKQAGSNAYRNGKRVYYRHSKGGDPSEWPEDLRVREFPGGAS